MGKRKNNSKNSNKHINHSIDKPPTRIMAKPKICLFDFDNNTAESLQSRGFNVTTASLGTPIIISEKAPTDERLCLLNHDWPSNIHEYDIFIIDMSEKKAIQYNKSEHTIEHNEHNNATYCLIEYPQTIFDPRAYAAKILKKEFSNILERKYILIVFASEHKNLLYNIVNFPLNFNNSPATEERNNYSFVRSSRFSKNIRGNEVEIAAKETVFSDILDSLKDSFQYEVTFEHPTKWVDSQSVPSDDFVSLMTNKNKQVISYVEFDDNSIVMVLPQMTSKERLLCPLLDEILPSIFYDIFPESTLFAWKNDKEYWLPNYGTLYHKKIDIEKENLEAVEKVDNEIIENANSFAYLHDLLSGTDDELVDAVEKYLRWLGFTNIKKMDSEGKLKEEDIQVELEEGILIIEVKGIGGTSKNDDCNQIGPIKHRRCKERNKFDVFALYLVNHQRYLPPHSRKNPPFSEEQISDAENAERGLLTTWELFKGYRLVEENIFSKEYMRSKILEYGLITFAPSEQQFIGKVKECLKENTVLILDLINTCIRKNDSLIIERNGDFKKVTVLNLQQDNTDIDEVNSGETGILVDKPVKRNSNVFLNYS